jgi:thiamine-phosphate pyrophosphorylase
MVTWRTMAITDRRRLGVAPGAAPDTVVQTLTAFAVAAAAAGLHAVQLREYDMPDGLLRRCAVAMRASTTSRALPLVVNDRAHVAMASGVAGVHLRGTSMPASRVRAVVGGVAVVGRSVHASGDLAPDELEGVDYVLFGTVFSSASKPPGAPVAGLDRLEACCAKARRPVMAVGGVTVANCRMVAERGAAGIAAIGLFADAWRQGGSALGDVVTRLDEAWQEARR